jgi:DNA repair exonuclease SbcCD ATPase subunit
MTPAEEKLLFQTLGEIKGELKQLNRRIDETNRRMDDRFNAMQKYVDRRFADMDKRFEDINKRFGDMNRRFEDMNKRFEDINKRFEDINKRFEDINKRLDSMLKLMGWIIAGLFGLVAAFGALLVWDRKSTIKAATQEIEESLDRKFEISKFKELLKALRELAKTDKKLEEILKQFNLL